MFVRRVRGTFKVPDHPAPEVSRGRFHRDRDVWQRRGNIRNYGSWKRSRLDELPTLLLLRKLGFVIPTDPFPCSNVQYSMLMRPLAAQWMHDRASRWSSVLRVSAICCLFGVPSKVNPMYLPTPTLLSLDIGYWVPLPIVSH